MDSEAEIVEQRSKFRLRFSLLAFFLFITLVCVLVAWFSRPKRVVATALFRVAPQAESMFGDKTAILADEQTYDAFKNTQVAALHSHFLLQAAARKTGVATLTILANQTDQVDWIERNLKIEYPEGGEYLAISMEGPKAYATDLKLIVDAVAQAYDDEVVYKERARRLNSRDMANRSLESLHKKIAEKWELYRTISQDSGGSSDVRQAKRELVLNRLDGVDSEVMRLESERVLRSTGGDGDNADLIEKRLTELRAQQAELEERLFSLGDEPLELKRLQAEIEQLQEVANQLSSMLIRADIDSNMPQRIEKIQPAVVAPVD